MRHLMIFGQSSHSRVTQQNATGSHKNLSVLEIARSVVLANVEDAAR
ncbi:hypothetical protein T12_6820 [Trichinella patagoniensis]|uniref:Uncharacterized protein n=1 Tax=Trichinella patagoniensis TaxID=990121 RepID=A0A0V0Z0Z8_9BILA|nr:hypothetical protein T12_6820 [Trichinella patagoniensis]